MKIFGSCKRVLHIMYFIMFLEGLILLGVGFYQGYYLKRVLSFAPIPEYVLAGYHTHSLPMDIIIPKMSLTLPVKQTRIVNGIWEVSDNSANHLLASAVPGDKGNIVIYGHNTAHILGSLKYLRPGDILIIKTEDEKNHEYKIWETKIITPNDTSDVQPKNYEMLTLFTCSGFLDTKRLVIHAEPLSINDI